MSAEMSLEGPPLSFLLPWSTLTSFNAALEELGLKEPHLKDFATLAAGFFYALEWYKANEAGKTELPSPPNDGDGGLSKLSGLTLKQIHKILRSKSLKDMAKGALSEIGLTGDKTFHISLALIQLRSELFGKPARWLEDSDNREENYIRLLFGAGVLSLLSLDGKIVSECIRQSKFVSNESEPLNEKLLAVYKEYFSWRDEFLGFQHTG